MGMLRVGIAKNCRRYKSSVRAIYTLRKKTGQILYVNNKEKGATRT